MAPRAAFACVRERLSSSVPSGTTFTPLNLGLWPDTVAFDPIDGAESLAIDPIVRGPAAALTAVALVAGEAVRASGWSIRAAAALARRWRGPRRVVLADLDFERPRLHEIFGVPNDEGMADSLEFGISFGRIARAVDGEAFDLAPAGPPGGDPGLLLRSSAWTRILLEVAARNETLLAYAPARQDGMLDVVERAGAVIVLATPEEAVPVIEMLPHPYAVLAVLTPAEDSAVASSGAGPAVAGEPIVTAAGAEALRLPDAEFERIRLPRERATREALIADLRNSQRAARLAPSTPEPAWDSTDRGEPPGPVAPAVVVPTSGAETAREMRAESAAEDVPLDTIEPTLVRASRPGRGWRGPLLWSLLGVLILSVLAGVWHYFGDRLGLPPFARPAITPPPVEAPPVLREPSPPPVPASEEALPYAVAMEAYQNLQAAFERVDALHASQSDLGFHIVPLERDGRLYYYVMAGPVTDSAAATALRDTLLARRIKTAATPSDVRHAPLALLVGDYGAREAAERLIGELRELDIPAYMIVGTAADAEPVYRVFVGGFAGPAEADSTRQMLRAAGISDRLVTRTRSSIS